MKRAGCVALSMILYLFIVGMGSFGNPDSVRVPETGTNYSATIVDLSGMATRVERLSFDGQANLSGQMGDADVSITFDRVKTITFVLHEDTLTAEVELKDGKTVHVVMNKRAVCYGRFAYGSYKIGVMNIKSIKVHGKVSEDKEP
jgi:hypothetical protein